jgi:hypothetical protein
MTSKYTLHLFVQPSLSRACLAPQETLSLTDPHWLPTLFTDNHTQSEAVQIFLSLRPGFMDEYFAPAGAAGPGPRGGKGRPSAAGLDMAETCVSARATALCMRLG